MGQIAATTNGGASWRTLQLPTSAALHDAAFPTARIGYALTTNGGVFRTADEGSSWSTLSPDAEKPDALLAPNASTVLLIGPRGVRRSLDGGASFTPVQGVVIAPRQRRKPIKLPLSTTDLARGAEIASGTIFARGNDVFESTDDGSSWTLIPRPLRRHQVSAMSFVNATTGYEVADQRLFFTRDRGRRWREIRSVDVDDVESEAMLSFSNPSDGYVIGDLAGNTNVLLRTEDGGRTWAPQTLGFPLGAVSAGGSVDYAAEEGVFFEPGLGVYFAAGEPVRGLFQTTVGGRSPKSSTLALSIAGPHRLTRAQLRRSGDQVRLAGRLSPALGGEIVTIKWSMTNERGRLRWARFKNVVVSSAGTFALTASVNRTADFVAEWTGDDIHSGAGTPAVRLTVSSARVSPISKT